MTNRISAQQAIATEAHENGWAVNGGAAYVGITRGEVDVTVWFNAAGQVRRAQRSIRAERTIEVAPSVGKRETVIGWLLAEVLDDDTDVDLVECRNIGHEEHPHVLRSNCVRPEVAIAATAHLVETEHPEVGRTSGIPMVHRVYEITGADLLVELPASDGTGARWSYRVTTVRTITQRDPQAFGRSRSRSTWVNLIRQTKAGRDFTRGGFASVTLDRLHREINPTVGLAVRDALEAVAVPVAIIIGSALPGDLIGYHTSASPRLRVETAMLAGRGPKVGVITDTQICAQDIDTGDRRMIIELPTTPMIRWEW